jgi:hypothetical protein
MFDPMMNLQLQRSLRNLREQWEDTQPTRLLEPAGEAKSKFRLEALFSRKPVIKNQSNPRLNQHRRTG